MARTHTTNRIITLENNYLRVSLDIETLLLDIVFKVTNDGYLLDIRRTSGIQIGAPDPNTTAVFASLGTLIKWDHDERSIVLRFEKDGILFEGGISIEPDQADVIGFIRPITFGSTALVKASFPGALVPRQKDKINFVIPIQQGVLMEEGMDRRDLDVPGRPEAKGEELVTLIRHGKQTDFTGLPHILQSFFWGILGTRSSVLAILETFHDVAVQFDGGRISRPVWQPSMGHLRYERRIRYRFLKTGSYVDLALAYRRYLESKGGIKTLKQKAAERPILEKALGACYVFFGYYHDELTDYPAVLQTLKQRGIEKAFCSGLYTFYFGNPSISWPGLRLLDQRAMAKQVRALGYLFGGFINYGLMGTDFPGCHTQSVIKCFDGKEKIGFRLNDAVFYERCRELLPYENIQYEETWKDLDFLDLDQAIDWRHECFDPCHPHDHQRALEQVIRIFRRMLEKGLVVMGEAHGDERIPFFDIMRTKTIPHIGQVPAWLGLPNRGWTIPLAELMFHDCFLYTWWEGDSYDNPHNHPEVGGNAEIQAAQDALFGDPPMIFPAGKLFEPDRANPGRHVLFRQDMQSPIVQKSIDLAVRVCRHNKRVAADKMVNHRFLDDEGYVQQTEFESGVSVIANFGKQDFRDKDSILCPNGWKTF